MTRSNRPEEPAYEETAAADDAVIGRAFRWSLALFACIAIAVVTAILLRKPQEEKLPEQATVHLPETRPAPPVKVPQAPFRDVTQEAGIHFRHVNGAYGDKLLPETMGGGCAFFDFDNDGDQDLLLINSRYWPGHKPAEVPEPTMALYRNDGTGKFEEVAADVGLAVTMYGMGVAVGDYDNDGWVDVFISAVGPNRLFQNRRGRFVDVTEEIGVAGNPQDWGSSAGFFDYDNDGDLDLFVCNYLQWSREYDLDQGFTLTGNERAYGTPKAFEGSFSCLYRNDGSRFTDVSAQAGVQVLSATGKPMGKSLGLVPIDIDRDGWMDVIVANDTVQNFLFLNQRDGTFREIGAFSGIAFDSTGNARGAMGIDAARFRDDDSLGVGIGNFANEMTALYVARADGLQFVDDAISTGLGPATRLLLTFGLFFFDYDLDGRLDILAANGHLEDDINKVQQTQHYEQPPQLFWNCGPEQRTEFLPVEAASCGEDFLKPMVGRGATYADIDGDGDLDVLLTAVGAPPRLLRNEQQLGHHWVRFKLQGRRCNRDAIGAWIELHVGERVLRRQVMPTRSYLSQVELPVTFGLGSTQSVDRMRILWPDGTQQVVGPVPIDQTITVEQATRASRHETSATAPRG